MLPYRKYYERFLAGCMLQDRFCIHSTGSYCSKCLILSVTTTILLYLPYTHKTREQREVTLFIFRWLCDDIFNSTNSAGTVHSTEYTVHSAQYTVHSTQCTVQSTLYTVQGTQYRVHCTLHTVHSTEYTVHSTQCLSTLEQVT